MLCIANNQNWVHGTYLDWLYCVILMFQDGCLSCRKLEMTINDMDYKII